jgi:hypothetical protein
MLRGVGKATQNAIVASICPKVTVTADPASDPDYGYNPAVNAIIDRLKVSFGEKCLPRALEVDMNGHVPCVVIEARRRDANGSCAACEGPGNEGRAPLSTPTLEPVARGHLKDNGQCDAPGMPACSEFCLCEIEQLSGSDLDRCQSDPQAVTDAQGFCYVDGLPRPGERPDSAALRARAESVEECPATQRRMLRFTSELPASGAVAFLSCVGKTLR